MFGKGPLAILFQVLLRAETEIRLALSQQPLRMFAIDFQPIGLSIGTVCAANIGTFVPIEPQPFQILEQRSLETRFTALNVGVLDAQHHRAALLPRKEPVEQRGTGIADVQMSGG